jgi:hypothetical protein
LKAAREDWTDDDRLVTVTASDTKEGSMSEQDRVDSPEHDEVEAHKHHMTDDADSTTASDDVEAHGTHHTAATQEPDSDDDVEAHGTHHTAATQEPDSDDDVEAHGTHHTAGPTPA